MRVRWTDPAVLDATGICDYTQKHLGTARARQTALQLVEAAHSLAAFPYRGRPGRKPDTRELVLRGLPFLIVYRVGQNVIEILRLLHGARSWP